MFICVKQSNNEIFRKIETFTSNIWNAVFKNFFIDKNNDTPNVTYIDYIIINFEYQKNFTDKSKRNPSIIFFKDQICIMYKLFPSELKKIAGDTFTSLKIKQQFIINYKDKNTLLDFKGTFFYGDPRIWIYNDELFFTLNMDKNNNDIVVIFSLNNYKIPLSILYTRDKIMLKNQKNWQFICLNNEEREKFSLRDDEILMLTDFYPTYRITKITFKKNNCDTFLENSDINYEKLNLDEVYNTSNVVEYDENYFITILHTGKKSKVKPYICTFLLINRENLQPAKISPYFKFVKNSFIEFPSGLTKKDDIFYISVGINDAGYIILKIKKTEIEMLNFFEIFGM